ncbi:MAG: hypothetical protein WA252_20305 [Candidatus Sulfotelmatobacter sp.]
MTALILLGLAVGGVFCVLFYALYKKGDVRAVFSHGKTSLELEAKESQFGAENKKLSGV